MSFWLLETFFTVGLLLGFSGVVQLSVGKKTGAWREGGAAALAGAIIVGVFVLELVRLPGHYYDKLWGFMFILIMVGLVLVFNGVVQLLVRSRTGRWKEGGASFLAGLIVTAVSVVEALLFSVTIGWFLLMPGLVLAFNGAVQLGVRERTGPWKEGGASLLAGAIIVGGTVLFWKVSDMSGFELLWSGRIGEFCLIAGLVVLLNGVVQVCVRNKTGRWKEGGASVLAGVIVAGALSVLWFLWSGGFLVRLLQ